MISKIPVLFSRLKPGDQIVFRQARYGVLIKTIDHLVGPGWFFVTGSDALSVDSRQFGPIDKKDVLGKVVWHIRDAS